MTTDTLPEIEHIRRLAASARFQVSNGIKWHADQVRVELGLAEVIEWPQDDPIRRLRRNESGESNLPEGSRTLFCSRSCAPYTHVHLIRDSALVASLTN